MSEPDGADSKREDITIVGDMLNEASHLAAAFSGLVFSLCLALLFGNCDDDGAVFGGHFESADRSAGWDWKDVSGGTKSRGQILPELLCDGNEC